MTCFGRKIQFTDIFTLIISKPFSQFSTRFINICLYYATWEKSNYMLLWLFFCSSSFFVTGLSPENAWLCLVETFLRRFYWGLNWDCNTVFLAYISKLELWRQSIFSCYPRKSLRSTMVSQVLEECTFYSSTQNIPELMCAKLISNHYHQQIQNGPTKCSFVSISSKPLLISL